MTLIMQRSLACLVVLSTQGQDENSVIAVRLLIHGKGRELGDLVYVTKLHVSGARKLLCCAAVDKEDSVVDYVHVHLVLTPHTANTTVCANMQYWYTMCVCIPSYTGGTK